MKIICLVKFVPNVDNFKYDYENNTIVRENVNLIINPDDASALEFALSIKDKCENTIVEVISMGPLSLESQLKDILRRNVDKLTLISDTLYRGSDSFVTSNIIGKFIKTLTFDLILSGTHALDGDTGHVAPQVAEILGLEQFSNVIKINEFSNNAITFEVDMGKEIYLQEIFLPAFLSFSKESKYKLRYVKYSDLKINVDDKFFVISNKDLGFDKNEVGLLGSPTKVVKTFTKKLKMDDKIVLKNDEKGIEKVYEFLKSRGIV